MALEAGCGLVVDAGFSFTHAVPMWNNRPLLQAVRRMNVGGKALTNVLKEAVSYRAWNMMDETFIMDHAKEQLCFVSLFPTRHLPLARKRDASNIFRAEYLLPDGVTLLRGQVKDRAAAMRAVKAQEELWEQHIAEEARDEEGWRRGKRGVGLAETIVTAVSLVITALPLTLSLTVSTRPPPTLPSHLTSPGVGQAGLAETIVAAVSGAPRVIHPLLPSTPSALLLLPGVSQAGLAETIVAAVSAAPRVIHPLLYSNIVLVGGSCQFPFFKERLALELRPLVPNSLPINISLSQSPVVSAWKGGSELVKSGEFARKAVTKKQYEELGFDRVSELFKY
ncbi:unnamed protein product [Closterium sp. Yama58-4]|nr:unnamed protein product [Closterium sp. Yama58-4]